MQIPEPYFFAVSSYTMLLISIISFVVIIQTIQTAEITASPSAQRFQFYFLVSLIGFTFAMFRDVSGLPVNLSNSGVFYQFCSLLLYLTISDISLKSFKAYSLYILHIIGAALVVVFASLDYILLHLSVYALIIYPLILFHSVRFAKSEKNFGFHFISVAVCLVLVSAFISILTTDSTQTETGYILLTSSATIGYVLVGIGYLAVLIVRQQNCLKQLATKDPLTGLLNRRGMDLEIRTILASVKRDHTNLSIVTVDLDYFKKINDQYGHDAGDQVLIQFAQLIMLSARETDICCRLGGEEFVLVLPDTDADKALLVAERIRRLVEITDFVHDAHQFNVTASFGVVTDNTDRDIDSFLKDADKALYSAKADGRNCIRQAY